MAEVPAPRNALASGQKWVVGATQFWVPNENLRLYSQGITRAISSDVLVLPRAG